MPIRAVAAVTAAGAVRGASDLVMSVWRPRRQKKGHRLARALSVRTVTMAYVQSLDGDEAWWLWAKSDAGGRPHSLPGHLLDSGAVAELIWSDFLSSSVRATLDEISNGRGRDLLVLLAAWHDLGKATPAFQAQCGPDCFMVIEKWESLDALKAHSAAPHMVAYGAITREMVASRAIHILQPA